MILELLGLRRRNGRKPALVGRPAARRTAPPTLERLEDRLTPSSTLPNPLFVLQTDQSLWRQTSAGRQLLSPAGTILAASAVTDGAGNAEAFAIASDHTLWQYAGAGWRELSAGAFRQV